MVVTGALLWDAGDRHANAASGRMASPALPWMAAAGAPLFIYGESLGGGMAIHCSLREPHAFAGMVLFAPMVATAAGTEPPYAVQLIGR